MKYLLLSLFLLVSCQDYNSNSGDRGKYSNTGLNETDPNFEKAYNIIQTRCVSCHDGEHDAWAEFKSNDDWLGRGLVVAGDPNNSLLIRRIKNSGLTESDMPPDMSSLPTAEYQHLRKWVQEFQ